MLVSMKAPLTPPSAVRMVKRCPVPLTCWLISPPSPTMPPTLAIPVTAIRSDAPLLLMSARNVVPDDITRLPSMVSVPVVPIVPGENTPVMLVRNGVVMVPVPSSIPANSVKSPTEVSAPSMFTRPPNWLMSISAVRSPAAATFSPALPRMVSLSMVMALPRVVVPFWLRVTSK